MSELDRTAYFLLKPFTRACKEFDLLAEGDRVAVAVSGGKDSRALLQLLLRHQRKTPYRFELMTFHVVGAVITLSRSSCRRASRCTSS